MAVSAEPLREESHRSLMRVLASMGRRAEALRRFDEMKRLLRDEWGMDPSTFSEMRLAEGDLLRIMTPGGAGLGMPAERSAEEVALDVREGKVTAEAARSVYGQEL